MPETTNAPTKTDNTPANQPGGFSAIEKLSGIFLANRYIWLVLLMAWATVAHLSFWQVRFPRFDAFELVAHVSFVLELALIGFVTLILGSFPAVQAAWAQRYPNSSLRFNLAAIAGLLSIVLLFALLIAPVLYFHRYPELVEANVRVPLMLLQRYLLVLLSSLFAYNVGLIFRFYFRFPWSLSAVTALLCHSATAYWVTWLSYTKETYYRLNDVFYYNMLHERFEWFPDLSQPMLFHNIEPGYFNHYFSIAVAMFVVSLVLWMPRSLLATSSQK